MKIRANRTWHPPCLVYPLALERLWRRDSLWIDKWEGEPRHLWFKYVETKESFLKEKEAFLIADISLETMESGHHIYFTNGRHRTRWLLQQGLKEIPVGIYEEHIELAKKIGLLIRRVNIEEEFPLV